MAIDTTNEKLSIIEWCSDWEPGLPMVHDGSFSQGELQQLIHGYSGILWETHTGPSLSFVLDMNTRLFVYLKALYSEGAGADLTTMVVRYLRAGSGDYNRRFAQLIDDATAAMS